jgi:hypothetical protein
MVEKEPRDSSNALADAQLEKLKLEIENLRTKKWEDRISKFVPMVTALVAVIGLLITINQFTAQQRKDREAKVQEQNIKDETQIRSNIDQLLSLTTDKNLTIARVSFLLEDLKALIKRRPDEQQKITEILSEFIQYDCNFNNLRDIRFDVAAVKRWEDYRAYLRNHSEVNDYIIDKYIEALGLIHDEDVPYFEAIQYEKGFGYKVEKYTEPSRFERFIALVDGFSLHLGILNEKSDGAAKQAVQRFQREINNPTITKQLFE